jgi:hypothetical protein
VGPEDDEVELVERPGMLVLHESHQGPSYDMNDDEKTLGTWSPVRIDGPQLTSQTNVRASVQQRLNGAWLADA